MWTMLTLFERVLDWCLAVRKSVKSATSNCKHRRYTRNGSAVVYGHICVGTLTSREMGKGERRIVKD